MLKPFAAVSTLAVIKPLAAVRTLAALRTLAVVRTLAVAKRSPWLEPLAALRTARRSQNRSP